MSNEIKKPQDINKGEEASLPSIYNK